MDTENKLNTPFFSIIIPTYNRVAFLSKSVNSVLTQNFSDWELIVVNDASTDTTADFLSGITDKRVKVIHNEKNIERSASRNKGIEAARGKYICFLDSDDYYLENHLSDIYDRITHEQMPEGLFYTDVRKINTLLKNESIVRREIKTNVVCSVISDHIPVIAIAVHSDILKKYKFDTSISINEDVYLIALIAAKFKLYHIPVATVVWIVHENNSKNYVADYWKQQIVASGRIFNDKEIRSHISSAFVNNKFHNLYCGMVQSSIESKSLFKAALYILKAFFYKPFNKTNKTNVVNYIYNLPGGSMLRKFRSEIR